MCASSLCGAVDKLCTMFWDVVCLPWRPQRPQMQGVGGRWGVWWGGEMKHLRIPNYVGHKNAHYVMLTLMHVSKEALLVVRIYPTLLSAVKSKCLLLSHPTLPVP